MKKEAKNNTVFTFSFIYHINKMLNDFIIDVQNALFFFIQFIIIFYVNYSLKVKKKNESSNNEPIVILWSQFVLEWLHFTCIAFALFDVTCE